jgi:hypothetical protein
MGKRKRSRKDETATVARRHRTLWTESMIEELLVFLDYGVHKKMKSVEIDEEAAQHLSRECGNGDYFSTQVRSKLRWLWREFGPSHDISDNPDQIYEEGSKRVSWVEEEQRERLACKLRALIHQKHTEFLTSPRKTRSSSQALIRSTASPGTFRSASVSSTITFKGSKTTQTVRTHNLRQNHPNLNDHAEKVRTLSSSTPKLTAT